MWKKLALDDVADVSAGNSAPQKKELFLDGEYDFVRTSDVGQIRFGEINEARDKLNEKGISGLSLKKKGSILFPKSGASTFLNHRVILLKDAYVASHLAAIKADNNKLLDRFLLYQLSQIRSQDLVQDHDYPSLKLSDLKKLEISVPPLEEQKRIVAILDEAFAGIDQAIANTEQNIQNARELFESYLNTIFTQKGEGWVEKDLKDICEITAKLIDPKEEEFLDLPHIGAGNMVSQSDELIDVQTAREEGLISGKFVFDKGVVLYSKIRPYLMKVSRPDYTGLCSADVYPLMPNKGVLDRDFLFYMLLSKDFTDYAVKGSARAGMPKVNRPHLFAYRTHIPSLEKQRILAQQINEIHSLSKTLEISFGKKLEALKELKQSLLQKAFAGELTSDLSEAA